MFEQDVDAFMGLLEDAFSLNPNWKPLTPKGKALFFKALEPYPLEVVSKAMTAHIRDPQRGKFQPAPADLIAQIGAASGGDGRPGAEEAWALVQGAANEHETVIWTEEMRAAFSTCQVLLEKGDEIGARMAFKEAYTRMVAEAARNNRQVKWEVSLGRDSQKRAIAIERAVTAGRLPAAQANALLPAPMREQMLRLSGSGETKATEDGSREGLARLKAELAKLRLGTDKAIQRREAEQQAQRDAEAQRKRDIHHQVAEYAEARGI